MSSPKRERERERERKREQESNGVCGGRTLSQFVCYTLLTGREEPAWLRLLAPLNHLASPRALPLSPDSGSNTHNGSRATPEKPFRRWEVSRGELVVVYILVPRRVNRRNFSSRRLALIISSLDEELRVSEITSHVVSCASSPLYTFIGPTCFVEQRDVLHHKDGFDFNVIMLLQA